MKSSTWILLAVGCSHSSPAPGNSDAREADSTTIRDDATHGSDATGGAGAALYWAEYGAVMTAALDGTNAHAVVGTPLTGTGLPSPAPYDPTAVAVDPTTGVIYWADNGADAIEVVDPDGSNLHQIYSNTNPYSNPSAIAVDAMNGLVFWTEAGAVMSAHLDGSDVTAVHGAPLTGTGLPAGSTTFPDGIAVDPAAHQVYWADNADDAIRVAGYDGSGVSVIYQNHNPYSNPNAVALDRTNGLVFWAEAGAVMSAHADGSGAAAVVGAPLTGTAPPGSAIAFPDGVAVDPAGHLVYRADNTTDAITVTGYDGSAAAMLYHNGNSFSNPLGVALR